MPQESSIHIHARSVINTHCVLLSLGWGLSYWLLDLKLCLLLLILSITCCGIGRLGTLSLGTGLLEYLLVSLFLLLLLLKFWRFWCLLRRTSLLYRRLNINFGGGSLKHLKCLSLTYHVRILVNSLGSKDKVISATTNRNRIDDLERGLILRTRNYVTIGLQLIWIQDCALGICLFIIIKYLNEPLTSKNI